MPITTSIEVDRSEQDEANEHFEGSVLCVHDPRNAQFNKVLRCL